MLITCSFIITSALPLKSNQLIGPLLTWFSCPQDNDTTIFMSGHSYEHAMYKWYNATTQTCNVWLVYYMYIALFCLLLPQCIASTKFILLAMATIDSPRISNQLIIHTIFMAVWNARLKYTHDWTATGTYPHLMFCSFSCFPQFCVQWQLLLQQQQCHANAFSYHFCLDKNNSPCLLFQTTKHFNQEQQPIGFGIQINLGKKLLRQISINKHKFWSKIHAQQKHQEPTKRAILKEGKQ